MSDPQQTNDLLDAVARVLLRCFILSYLFLLLWVGCYLLAGDLFYRINGPLFGLTQHEMNLMSFYGIVLVKCFAFLVCLFPYIAIRMVLQKRKA
jgi:hypothetical protein